MSRSGYTDDGENPGLWRGTVASAIRGKRGQAFLREMLTALDTMHTKELARGELIEADGSMCAIGAVGIMRGVDLTKIDPEDYDTIAKTFGISEPLAREIMFMNDDCDGWIGARTPAMRWQRMRAWVANQLLDSPASMYDAAIAEGRGK